MCGIAGIISKESITNEEIDSITSALSHRGPDAKGIYLHPSGVIALGHTRLSIIDLSTSANQPFFSGSGRYVVIFNGEVYNFQEIKTELIATYNVSFKTYSDTEVIAEAFAIWGSEMVKRLQGMFAIAIWDLHERKLFLFRDRLGKKPLFYFQSGTFFAFASEIKSLLKHPVIRNQRKLNKNVINTFLHLGYIPEPDSIYTCIKKFPAGCSGEIRLDLQLQINCYWRFEDHVKNSTTSDLKDCKQQFKTLLNEAVKKRLISDVPLGAFLSGGIDSSLITALATQNSQIPVKTFSIGFKDNKFDESSFARDVAHHLKTDHTGYVLEEKEAVDLLETYLHQFDEPFADTSAIPTMLVSKLARQDVKVVLTGDGGDELFQGYGAYKWADRLENTFWKKLKQPLRSAMLLSGKNRWQRVSHLLDPVEPKAIRSHIFSQEQYFFTQREIKELLFNKSEDFVPFDYDEGFLAGINLSAGEKQAIFDLGYYLKDDLLVKVDRASMFYALECRCPLLDYHVVEYALKLDISFKIRNGKPKWLLKEILREYLPDRLVDRPKWGFSIPLMMWLKGDLRYLIEDYLSEEVIKELGIMNPHYVQKLKKEFLAGKDYLYNRLWVIIVLNKWLMENRIG